MDSIIECAVQDSDNKPASAEYLKQVIHLNIPCALDSASNLPENASSFAKGGLSPSAMRRVVAFMKLHLNEPLNTHILAAEIGFSPFHFLRSFKQTVGQTPYQYILQLRLDQACEMLKAPCQSIHQIALSCGFGGSAQLARAFRRANLKRPKQVARVLQDKLELHQPCNGMPHV